MPKIMNNGIDMIAIMRQKRVCILSPFEYINILNGKHYIIIMHVLFINTYYIPISHCEH